MDARRARRCQISGGTLQYSQIWETRTGDWFDLGLPGRGGSRLASPYSASLAASSSVAQKVKFRDNLAAIETLKKIMRK
jgi:hypothetical protein